MDIIGTGRGPLRKFLLGDRNSLTFSRFSCLPTLSLADCDDFPIVLDVRFIAFSSSGGDERTSLPAFWPFILVELCSTGSSGLRQPFLLALFALRHPVNNLYPESHLICRVDVAALSKMNLD